MSQIVNYFWQMCLLRTGPEHVPASGFVLGLVAAIYALMAFLSLLVARDLGPAEAFGFIVIGISLEAVFVFGILMLKNVSRRFPATLTALLGTNIIVQLVTLPISTLAPALRPGTALVFVESLLLATFVWWLVIAGFILHRAARISLVQGIVVVFGMEIVTLALSFSLFRPAA